MTAAIVSAIENALAPLGVRIRESPITPVRLLELIVAAQPGHDARTEMPASGGSSSSTASPTPIVA